MLECGLGLAEEVPEGVVRSLGQPINEQYLRVKEFGIVPRVYDEFTLNSHGKTGNDGGNTIGVFLYVAGNCEYCGPRCLCELFLEIKAVELVQGDDRVCVHSNDYYCYVLSRERTNVPAKTTRMPTSLMMASCSMRLANLSTVRESLAVTCSSSVATQR